MHRPVMKLVSYDTKKYAFAEALAREAFRVPDLSRFHEAYLQRKIEQGGEPAITYGDNMAARELFKSLTPESWFYKLHYAFMWNVIAPLFHYKLRYTMPYFRVQMAHSTSVSLWHRDVDVTGNGDLVTAWVPFVDTSGSNTVWVETEYGKQDYQPVPVRYGEILFFDSAFLWHGSVQNDSEVTRLSMDIRITPMRLDVPEPDFGILAPRPDWCIAPAVVPERRPPSGY
jgi:hypothetical protein